MNIIGQEVLLNKLNNYNSNNLPKAMIFIGDQGCGKRYIAKYLADNLELANVVLETKEDLEGDKLQQYLYCPIHTVYTIPVKAFDEKLQNKLLKFIEEPSNTVNVILTAESDVGILPTIMNRCIKYYFEPYTVEQLKKLTYLTGILPDHVYDICNTPGQLANVNYNTISKLITVCNNLITNIRTYSYAQLLGATALINYKEDYNKFDYYTFLKVFKYCVEKQLEIDYTTQKIKMFEVVNTALLNLTNIVAVAKEWYMLQFFGRLWEETHGETK